MTAIPRGVGTYRLFGVVRVFTLGIVGVGCGVVRAFNLGVFGVIVPRVTRFCYSGNGSIWSGAGHACHCLWSGAGHACCCLFFGLVSSAGKSLGLHKLSESGRILWLKG